MLLPDRPEDALPHAQTRRSAGRIPLDLTLFDMPPHQNPDPVSDNFILCFALRGTVRTEFQFGDGWRSTIVSPGTFMPITPPGTLGELVMDAPHRHLMLTLPMQAVAEIDNSCTGFGVLHKGAFRDQLVARLCLDLWDEAKSANQAGDLFADCARAALIAALTRRAQQSPSPPPKRAGFTPQAWARLARQIDDRLDENLSVSMLAAAAEMRETRLLQAFRQQTGLSPYRYVLQRRLEKAAALLASSHMGLADIALSTGFADQAHMTTAFARHFGRTPGAVRRALH
jgi:AraC family transcriptional regulator